MKKLIKIKKIKRKTKKINLNFNKFKLFILLILYAIIFIFLSPFSIINKEFIKKKYKIKICICTLGKDENKYIREFVEHYEKYGIDKIFLYDNNDINGEKFEEVINDYIEKGLVEILNWRGKKFSMYKIMNNCYLTHYEYYDWLLFYEIDEFLYLYNYTNVKEFLEQDKFKQCKLILLNLICHTDNDHLHYENKPLAKRFPKIVPIESPRGQLLEVKFILKGHISNVTIENMHFCNKKMDNCNGFGHINKTNQHYSSEPDYNYYYIDHYYSKSTEEFINKLNRGDAVSTSKKYYMERVNKYYLQSNFTMEKIKMIENGTGLDLSIYKKLLSKN